MNQAIRQFMLWPVCLCVLGMSVAQAQTARPNVIIILSDDQGYGDFSAHGNPVLKTPNLDRDGKPDFITGKRYFAHEYDPGAYEPLGLYWYRLLEGGTYTKHVIDYGSKTGGGMQIAVVDLDGDGDLDLIAPGKSGLYLFEQVEIQRQKERQPPR